MAKRKSADQEKKSVLPGLGSLLEGWKELSSSALKQAALKAVKNTPEHMEKMGAAGKSLKDLRQVAGVTIEELASAIDMKNVDLLKSVEEGKAALPFEILLRLASFYARNNPVPFVLKYARTYNPTVSGILEKIGIDKLVIKAEREIRFVQIFRSRDAARQLSDDGFEKVRAFTEQAFEMALHFVASGENIEYDARELAEKNAKESIDESA